MITMSERQRRTLEHIARDRRLDFIVAYGSRVSGRAHDDSDLDIAVLAEKDPDTDLFYTLFREASDVFPGCNVDLRFLNGADPLFSIQVVRDGVLLVGDQERYDDFRAFVNRRYIDDGMTYFPALDEHLTAQQEYLTGGVS